MVTDYIGGLMSGAVTTLTPGPAVGWRETDIVLGLRGPPSVACHMWLESLRAEQLGPYGQWCKPDQENT
jgi:hypothetical protein